MYVVMLKCKTRKTNVSMAPKLIEIDEEGSWMDQLCKLLDCPVYAQMHETASNRSFDIFFDPAGEKHGKTPSYCTTDGEIIFGDVVFAHCDKDEVLGISEDDAYALAIHLLINTKRMNEIMRQH